MAVLATDAYGRANGPEMKLCYAVWYHKSKFYDRSYDESVLEQTPKPIPPRQQE